MIKTFIRRASSSWQWSVVVFEIFGAVPFAAIFLVFGLADGALILGYAIRVLLVSGVFGVVMGVYSWFAVFRPIAKRKREAKNIHLKKQKSEQ